MKTDKSQPRVPRRSWFLRDRKGATAIEFALISPVFFLLLFGIIETSLVYLQAVVLEGSVRSATRMIRTGQAQISDSPVTVFEDALCSSFIQIVDCHEAVYYMASADKFAMLAGADLFNEDGTPRESGFLSPGPNEAVLVTVGYRWVFFTPFVGELLSGDGSNAIVISSTAVFRNEPFPAAS